jgi:hypothetical protein
MFTASISTAVPASVVYQLVSEQARRSKEALLVKLVACSWGGALGLPPDKAVRGCTPTIFALPPRC